MEKFPETKEKYTHTATRSTEYAKIDKTRKENPHYLPQLKHYVYRTKCIECSKREKRDKSHL